MKGVAAGFFLIACVAWLLAQQPAAPSSPLAATGTIGILVGGQPIAAEPNINFSSGNGILQIAVDNPSARRVDVTSSFNTVLIPTHDTIHANENFCDSTNGTVFYTCNLPSKALVALARGNVFLLAADTACASGCSLRIDGVGQSPITIKQADGVTDPNGLLVAGQARWVWFDGKIFRLL